MGWGWTTVCKVGKRKRPFKLLLRPTILLMATWCKFPLFAACLCIPHTKNSVTQKASLNKPFNFQWIKVTGAGAATTMRTTAEAGTWCRLALNGNLSKRNGGDERKREREDTSNERRRPSLISIQITFPFLMTRRDTHTILNANVHCRSIATEQQQQNDKDNTDAAERTYHVFAPGTATCSNYSSGSLKRENVNSGC